MEEAERYNASEMLQLADVIYHAVAAGVAAAGASWSKKAGKAATDSYSNMLRALSVRAQGRVGVTHDVHGNPIAQSLAEVRDWLVELEVIG